MNDIKIEPKVYMPTGNRRKGEFKYPWDAMNIGDSFQFELTKKARSRICASACRYQRRTGKKFSVRNMGDHYRIWRTK